jgi:hypothetical protein
MARRGKSANRRSRQRRSRGAAQPRGPVTQPSASTPAEVVDAELAALPREAPSQAPAREAGAPSTAATSRLRRADSRVALGGPSRLTERAAAEYHYVLRDLRNIGVLMVVMAALLAAAAVGVNVLGIGRA